MDEFPKRPLEFYGVPVTDTPSKSLLDAVRREDCPFTSERCVKQRKSDPTQTIGACLLGFKGTPLVICPKRFLQRHQIFLDCIALLRKRGSYWVIPEVKIPGGHVDYFLVARQRDRIVDYVGIEIQSLDTTGTGGVWAAREDVVSEGGPLEDSYKYGINWKMSAKTILVQLHHKAATFEDLDKRLVLVLQTEFLEYIQREFDAAHLRTADPTDCVHFHPYQCVELNGAYSIILDKTLSTSVKGIDKLLKLGSDHSVSNADVIARLEQKMGQAFQLLPN